MADIIKAIKNNKKDIIIPVSVLLIICIVIPLALSITNMVTKDKIAELENKNKQKSMAALIKADDYKLKTANAEGTDFDYYEAKSSNEIKGYIIITSEKGYGGDVSVMTAINNDGTVKAVSILDVSTETPGLGQNASKESFYSQFKDKKSGISLLKSGADNKNNEVNAVTGATITSTAVTRAVNKALKDYQSIKESPEVN